uniref:Uncharacterized protein n=1 Tax=Romanomermis culicivorax TaxID=13658 RepID=A0A915J2G1_ROMCU
MFFDGSWKFFFFFEKNNL